MEVTDFINNDTKGGLLNRLKRIFTNVQDERSLFLSIYHQIARDVHDSVVVDASNVLSSALNTLNASYNDIYGIYKAIVETIASEFINKHYRNLSHVGSIESGLRAIVKDMLRLGISFVEPQYSISVSGSQSNLGDTDIIVCTLLPAIDARKNIGGNNYRIVSSPYIFSEAVNIVALSNELSNIGARFAVTGAKPNNNSLLDNSSVYGSGINETIEQVLASSNRNLVQNPSFEKYSDSGDDIGFDSWKFYTSETWTSKKIYYTNNTSTIGNTSMVISSSSYDESGMPVYGIYTNLGTLNQFSVYAVLFDAVGYNTNNVSNTSNARLKFGIKTVNKLLSSDVNVLVPYSSFYNATYEFSFGDYEPNSSILLSDNMSDFRTMWFIFITDNSITEEDECLLEISMDYGSGDVFPVFIDRVVVTEMQRLYTGGPYIAIIGDKCTGTSNRAKRIRVGDEFTVNISMVNNSEDMIFHYIFRDFLDAHTRGIFLPMSDNYVRWSDVSI